MAKWGRGFWHRLRSRPPAPGGERETAGEVPSIRWFDGAEAYHRHLAPQRRGRRARELEIGRRRTWRAWCAYCRSSRDLVVSAGVWLGENVNLREGLVCPGCGLGNRLRLLFKAVEEFCGSEAELRRKQTYVAERLSAFYQRLADRIDSLVGSEYLDPSCPPGVVRSLGSRDVRHEDLCHLSFADQSFDLVIHADVLEHVPDFRRAFAELHRILRPGGGMFFSVPFLHGRAEDEVRASVRADGSIVHHLPAVYHGNPVDPRGALAYRTYGWSLLETLRQVGFARAEAGVLADPELGFTSSNSPAEDFMEAVVFRGLRAG
jgi:SAM-dependent methyltransferase